MENEVIASQPAKAERPMLDTPFGILMEARLSQSANALSPILTTVFGMIFRKIGWIKDGDLSLE